MRAGVIVLLLSAIATGSAAQEAGLAGAWTTTAAQRDGAAAPDLIGHVLTFESEEFVIVGPGGGLLYAGTYAVDPAATPAEIDFQNTSGLAEGQAWLGIYQLEGAALTIADNAEDPARGRPETFAAPAGSGFVALEFQRAAPAD